VFTPPRRAPRADPPPPGEGKLGIVIAAIITTVAAMVVVGLLIRHLGGTAPRWLLILAFLSALPAQPVAFHFIRVPLHELFTQWIGPGALLTAITLCYAPVIEEPAKWFSLVLPSLRKALTPGNAIAVGLAVGLGFGVGEIWFLTERLARSPQLAALPFWQFSGFLLERLQVCFLHGAMVVLVFKRFAEGTSLWPAALLGVALHFFLNFPIFLAAINLPPFGREIWPLVLLAYVLLFTLGCAVWVLLMAQTAAPRDKAREA
jgi:hypothetical protein